MKVSWLRASDDEESFKMLKNLGFDVYSIEEPENTDKRIEDLVKDDYNIIVLSNEIASFSSDVITKYRNQDKVSIIIAPRQINLYIFLKIWQNCIYMEVHKL